MKLRPEYHVTTIYVVAYHVTSFTYRSEDENVILLSLSTHFKKLLNLKKNKYMHN